MILSCLIPHTYPLTYYTYPYTSYTDPHTSHTSHTPSQITHTPLAHHTPPLTHHTHLSHHTHTHTNTLHIHSHISHTYTHTHTHSHDTHTLSHDTHTLLPHLAPSHDVWVEAILGPYFPARLCFIHSLSQNSQVTRHFTRVFPGRKMASDDQVPVTSNCEPSELEELFREFQTICV